MIARWQPVEWVLKCVPTVSVGFRNGGIFLQPAEVLPVRDIPEETLRGWIAEDEKDAESIWRKAGKA
jgi:hypothetical protein